MRLLKISLFITLILLPAISLAARSTSKLDVKPQTAAAQPDTTAPVITITAPETKRGVKLVAKTSGITVTGRASDDSGVASVTVNGTAAQLDEQGNFSADLLLKPGENRITVVALDTGGNRGTETFTINRQGDAVAAAPQAVTASAEKGKSYALIIGINAYKQIPKLHTAVNDATTVAQLLKNDYGFVPTLLLDTQATGAALLKELNSIKNKLNPEDRLLIYYAGHGWNDKETETSYWLPVDADQNENTNWIEAKTITDQLKRSQARQVLVVADSCYSGTISRSFDPSLSGSGNRENYLKKLTEKPARILIASGGNEPVSDSGGSGHSVFADVFIKALKNPFDNRFTAEELLTRQIKESVAGRSDQTPEYKVIRNSGHDGGDFVFVRRK
jgi:hypothetical protein